jgi:hypothetical protein
MDAFRIGSIFIASFYSFCTPFGLRTNSFSTDIAFLQVLELVLPPVGHSFLRKFLKVVDQVTQQSLSLGDFLLELHKFFRTLPSSCWIFRILQAFVVGEVKKDSKLPGDIIQSINGIDLKSKAPRPTVPPAVASKPFTASNAKPSPKVEKPIAAVTDSGNHLRTKVILPARGNITPAGSSLKAKIVLKKPDKAGYVTRARGPAPAHVADLDDIDPDVERPVPWKKSAPPPPKKKRPFAVAMEKDSAEDKAKQSRTKRLRKADEYEIDADDDTALMWVEGGDDDFAPDGRVGRRSKNSVGTNRTQRSNVARVNYRKIEGSDEEDEDFAESSSISSDKESSASDFK